VSRQLSRLRALGLIKRISGTYHYYFTRLGRGAVAVCCRLTEQTIIPALASQICSQAEGAPQGFALPTKNTSHMRADRGQRRSDRWSGNQWNAWSRRPAGSARRQHRGHLVLQIQDVFQRALESAHRCAPAASNLTTYDLYLPALGNFPWFGREQMGEAIELFKQVVAIDPRWGCMSRQVSARWLC
jgi:hypothetical protein